MKITREQLSQFEECKSTEELTEIAKAEGIDITPEMAESLLSANSERVDEEALKMVSGGCSDEEEESSVNGLTCPKCGSKNTVDTGMVNDRVPLFLNTPWLKCNNCGGEFLAYDSPDRCSL